MGGLLPWMLSLIHISRIQFAQYGMLNIPEDVLENYAKEMLKKQESVEGLVNLSLIHISLIEAYPPPSN